MLRNQSYLLRNKLLAAAHKIDCQSASFGLTFRLGEDAIP
jgi:hypothetical protein